MAQNDLLEWFRRQYITGYSPFYTMEEVKKLSNLNGDINRQIRKLYAFGYLDIKLVAGKRAEYRIKKKYTNRVYSALSPLKKRF